MDFSKKVKKLISDQIRDWDLARKNYEGLKKVKSKRFDFGNYHIDIQFNPERMVSSAAKVDAQAIEARPCFLCQKNLPAGQQGLSFNRDYILLVNPFPIFPEHLTIPAVIHTDQRISGNFGSMLDLAAELNEFVIFYNGPQCGASAPDHLHFQAGSKGFMPIEKDFTNKNCCREIRKIELVSIYCWDNYLRGVITLKSPDKSQLINTFDLIYRNLQLIQPDHPEPMLNILATFDQEEWTIHVIPRTLHRPVQYFETGENQILLSPASVDMGGVLITPREEDFNKISKSDVTDLLRQVTFDGEAIQQLIHQL